MPNYQRLTDRTIAPSISLNDIVHIVITGDTSQSAAGSSYKASLAQLASVIGSVGTSGTDGTSGTNGTNGTGAAEHRQRVRYGCSINSSR